MLNSLLIKTRQTAEKFQRKLNGEFLTHMHETFLRLLSQDSRTSIKNVEEKWYYVTAGSKSHEQNTGKVYIEEQNIKCDKKRGAE